MEMRAHILIMHSYNNVKIKGAGMAGLIGRDSSCWVHTFSIVYPGTGIPISRYQVHTYISRYQVCMHLIHTRSNMLWRVHKGPCHVRRSKIGPNLKDRTNPEGIRSSNFESACLKHWAFPTLRYLKVGNTVSEEGLALV